MSFQQLPTPKEDGRGGGGEGEGDEQSIRESRADPACRFDYGRCFAPRFCNVFNRPEWMLVFWCLASFAQSGYMNGTANAILTTLEKRYQLTSTEVGFIVAVNDIVTILVVAPVSYYGGRGRKPRWIGAGCLILGIGSLLFALPHILFGSYEFTTTAEPLCTQGANNYNSSNSSLLCNVSTSGRNSYYIFLLAQILAGIGSTPLYTIGITYLDDNAGPKRSTLYEGIFMTTWVVGPAAGFLLAGTSLKLYVDIPAV